MKQHIKHYFFFKIKFQYVADQIQYFSPAAVSHWKDSRIRDTYGLMKWKNAHLRLHCICLSCIAACFKIKFGPGCTWLNQHIVLTH